VNNLKIRYWVDPSFNVSDLVVSKRSAHVENSIHSLNVRQEGVTETLTLARALD
jgi:hypothetical protein